MQESESRLPDYLLVKERPVGIAILSVLSFVGGIAMAGALVYAALFIPPPQRNEQLRRVADLLGTPVYLLIGSVVFLAALAIAGSIGMWAGRKWGWWLGSFWQVYAVFRNANAIVTTYGLGATMPAVELEAMPGGMAKYYVKFTVRAAFSALLYLYFFKASVRDFFGLRDANLWKVVIVQIGVCVAIIAGATAFVTLQ